MNLVFNRYVSGFLITLFLSGCAIWSNPNAVSKLPDSALNSKETGIVTMSNGSHEACTLTKTDAHLFERTAHRLVKSLEINHTSNKSEFETHHGAISAFALEPGSYYFFPYTGSTSNGMYDAFTIETTNDALAFEIKSGETIYLGELHMANECGTKEQYIVRDQYERDMAFVRKEKPSLLVRAPEKRLLKNIGPLTKFCSTQGGCRSRY